MTQRARLRLRASRGAKETERGGAPWRHLSISAAAALLACVVVGPAAAVAVSKADADLMFMLKNNSCRRPRRHQIGAAAALTTRARWRAPAGRAGDYDIGVIGNPLTSALATDFASDSAASTSASARAASPTRSPIPTASDHDPQQFDERARLRFVAIRHEAPPPGSTCPTSRPATPALRSPQPAILRRAVSRRGARPTPHWAPCDGLRDRLKVTLRLRPGETETLYLVADSESQSASLAPVPVPPALALLLGALGASRRWRGVEAGGHERGTPAAPGARANRAGRAGSTPGYAEMHSPPRFGVPPITLGLPHTRFDNSNVQVVAGGAQGA